MFHISAVAMSHHVPHLNLLQLSVLELQAHGTDGRTDTVRSAVSYWKDRIIKRFTRVFHALLLQKRRLFDVDAQGDAL